MAGHHILRIVFENAPTSGSLCINRGLKILDRLLDRVRARPGDKFFVRRRGNSMHRQWRYDRNLCCCYLANILR